MSTATQPSHVCLIGHSTLFYWWPVWAIGFVITFLTWFNDHRQAVVSPKTEVKQPLDAGTNSNDMNNTASNKDRWVLLSPTDAERIDEGLPIRVSSTRQPGLIWCFTLLTVIILTNVHFRGCISILYFLLIGASFGVWSAVSNDVRFLDVHLTLGGYCLVSTILFLFWVIVFFMDKHRYIIIEPNNVTVCLGFGESVRCYSTQSVASIECERDSLKHLLLGLGSGDLSIIIGGENSQRLEVLNVLRVRSKLNMAERLLRERPVVLVSPDTATGAVSRVANFQDCVARLKGLNFTSSILQVVNILQQLRMVHPGKGTWILHVDHAGKVVGIQPPGVQGKYRGKCYCISIGHDKVGDRDAAIRWFTYAAGLMKNSIRSSGVEDNTVPVAMLVSALDKERSGITRNEISRLLADNIACPSCNLVVVMGKCVQGNRNGTQFVCTRCRELIAVLDKQLP